MAYFKIVRKTLEINGSSRSTSIDLRAEVFSYDKNVSKFLFELTSKEAEIDLTGATVRVLLTYVGNDGKKGIIEDNGGVEAYTMNQIYYLLPEELRGYDGTVVMGLYVDLPSGEAIDIQNVQFRMFKSSIDDGAGVAGVVYFKSFEEWLFQVKEKALLEIQNIDDESERITEYADTKIKEYDDKFVQSNQKMSELQQSQIELSDQLNETNKKIDEADVYRKDEVFNKPESSANVIDNIAGTEKAILKNGLLIDGISGTGARDDNGTLIPFVQDDYYKLASTDTYVRNETLVSGRGAEIQFDFNVIETLESRYPAIFESSTTIAEKISKYKTIIKNVNANIIIRGRGIHSSTNVATNFSRLFLSWGTNYSNNTSLGIASSSDFSKINSNLSVLGINSISNKGYYTLFAVTRRTGASDNGAVSDGVTPAWVEVKDISLTVELEVNGRTIIESMIAANHIENLATEEEAETGEDNKKIMTPLRVMQSIKKFVENKFVSIAGNETIGGLKNFKDGLLVNDVSVLTARTASQRFDSSTSDEIQAGSIKFDRVGPYVFVDLNFQVRADRDITQDQNIFYGLKNELMCDTEYMDSITSYSGTTALINVLQTKMTARTTLVKSTWYVGKTFYKAKN